MQSHKKPYLIVLLFSIIFYSSLRAQDVDQLLNSYQHGFIENNGQVTDQNGNPNPAVKFILPLPNNNVVLKANGFSYDTYVADVKKRAKKSKASNPLEQNPADMVNDVTYKYHRVDVEFESANTNVEVVTEGKSDYYINYLIGDDGRQVKAHSYRKVTYKNIYPKIDVEFIARAEEDKPIEYNFIVHPGGDFKKIKMRYSGANASRLEGNKVELALAYGKLTESIPASYWEKTKESVNIQYQHIRSGRNQVAVGFENTDGKILTKNDQALIIDPTPYLEWGTYFGASGWDDARGIAIDELGNIFVTGQPNSTSSIATTNAFQTNLAGASDCFLAKFSSDGLLQWCTYYGGEETDISQSITTDASGNIFISGYTYSSSGIAFNGHQTTFGGGRDAFLVKFNSTGSRIWSTYYGGTATDEGEGIAVDGSGNIIMVGFTESSSSIGFAGHQTVRSGWYDGFVVKFDTHGTRLWGSYYGGSNTDAALAVSTDASENIFVGGYTSSIDANAISTPGAHQTTFSGDDDGYLVKFTPSGTRLWGTYYGGSGWEEIHGTAVDASGNVYAAGRTTSTTSIATIGSGFGGGYFDVFLTKFNSNGALQWGTYYGGPDWDETSNTNPEVAIDLSGNIYITGYTNSTSSIATAQAYQSNLGGSVDVFLARFNSSGVLQWGTYYGGPERDASGGIALDALGNVYITGYTDSNSGIASGHTSSLNSGGPDVFLAKFRPCLSGSDVTASEITCDICSVATRCQGSGTTQFTSTITNAGTIEWTITDDNPTVSNTISPAGLVTWDSQFHGQATITLTVHGCGPLVTRTKTITVTPQGPSPLVTLDEPRFVCPAGQAVFQAAIQNGGAAPVIEFFVNDVLQTSGGSSTFMVNEWMHANGSVVKCKVTNTDECVAEPTWRESSPLTVYTQLEGVVNILTPDGGVRCHGPGTTQFTPSEQITTYTWSLSPQEPGSSISGTGLATWAADHTGELDVILAASACPEVQTSIPYKILLRPPTPDDQVLNRCNWEYITLKDESPGNEIHWYAGSELLHTGDVYEIGNLYEVGTYNYQVEAVSPEGCPSPGRGDVQVQVITFCDERINWIESKSFDETTTIYGNSKNYFDFAGRPLQSQTKLFSDETTVFASQNFRDVLNRVAGSTLTATIPFTDFNYHYGFALGGPASPYKYHHFDTPEKRYTPDPLHTEIAGTLGWYYSNNNTLEPLTPRTSYPYSRTEFYEDGTGEVKRSASPGDIHRLGAGHEVLTGTFPVYHELDDYLAKRNDAGLTHPAGHSLAHKGVISVVKDQNGKYAISIADQSGNAVLSALKGTQQDHVLAVTNTVMASGNPGSTNYQPMTYFYLLEDAPVSITGSADFIAQDIISNVAQPAGGTFADPANGNKWPAGFYRILLNDPASEVTITWTNYYSDVSYQFYDDAGRLIYSVTPNGYKQWIQSVSFANIDKTSYQYNHQGWLLKMTEPDAGMTEYAYRKDGKIRFSQNAQQRIDNTFSYTNYDAQGRPLESGQYTLQSGADFTSLRPHLETTGDTWMTWGGTKTDWVKTYYDLADPSCPYQTQTFVRSAVSWTQNANTTTWYSYDEQGRVTWMAQKPAELLPFTFVTSYSYDFLGNVSTVVNTTYQNGAQTNTLYHHYEYDRNKRLEKTYTSTTGTDRKLRATYHYYLHGPLKRIELGDQLQGIDFVYNINGWLTHINHPDHAQDPGVDGNGNGFPQDAFGMTLDYYENGLFPISVNPMEMIDPMRRHRLPLLEDNQQRKLNGKLLPQHLTKPQNPSLLSDAFMDN